MAEAGFKGFRILIFSSDIDVPAAEKGGAFKMNLDFWDWLPTGIQHRDGNRLDASKGHRVICDVDLNRERSARCRGDRGLR